MGVKVHACTCGAFDDACLAKTGVGEPIFVLRAQDLTASAAVLSWAEEVEEAYYDQTVDVPASLAGKLRAARNTANAMRSWPNRKLPD